MSPDSQLDYACEPCHCLAHLLACEMCVCVCVLFVRGVVQGHEEMSLSGWPAAASALARAAKKNFWDLYFLGIFGKNEEGWVWGPQFLGEICL